jgi:hypothetical protein
MATVPKIIRIERLTASFSVSLEKVAFNRDFKNAMVETINTLMRPSVGSKLKRTTSATDKKSALEFLSLMWPCIRCDYDIGRQKYVKMVLKEVCCKFDATMKMASIYSLPLHAPELDPVHRHYPQTVPVMPSLQILFVALLSRTVNIKKLARYTTIAYGSVQFLILPCVQYLHSETKAFGTGTSIKTKLQFV